ncbi:MAG: hypothetical protein ACI9JL_002603 [Paracoccaceae bacterium]|jgi:hypothetical protein
MSDPATRFYTEIPVFDDFSKVVDDSVYRRMPEDWFIGLTDVVGSTKAIESGKYKSVNMAGAAAISAVINALGHQDFPFVFGGDGVSFAVPAAYRDKAADALARTARWVEEDLDLTLRAAMVPVGDIQSAGHDVRVARLGTSPAVAFAMFSGHGVEWAEAEMKQDRFAVDVAPPGARPDLTGLSCRWKPIDNSLGCILSLIVGPADGADTGAYDRLVGQVIGLFDGDGRGSHPIPERGPDFGWPPKGLELEARAAASNGKRAKEKFKIALISAIGWVLFKTGWKTKSFDPVHYRRMTGLNTDFRKFDDVLRMTVDCSAQTLARAKAMLETAKADGTIRYGIYEQDAAIMTCIVPSVKNDDHLHFLDGASGGYALAAKMMKAG